MRAVALAFLMSAAVLAQSQSPRFEAASLRQRDGKSPIGLLGMQVTPGRLIQRCATLRSLLFFAYRLDGTTPVTGLPNWASTPCGNGFPPADTYDFQATMPADASDADIRQMMQAFLVERFKLAAHMESRNMTGLALVEAPGGFKLKPTAKSDDPPRPADALLCPPEDPRCRRIALGSAPTSLLARAIGGTIGQPIVDRTGLAETYYFNLKWAGDNAPNSPFPSLSTALREAFGLELKAYNGPIDTLIIDYVEKPSPN